MNIEPGTRVRYTYGGYPSLLGELGTFVSNEDGYYQIAWDSSEEDGWIDWHTEDEFEVIDE